MFATGEERSPVTIFKDFLWRCPLKVRKTGKTHYCERQPMGVKKIKDVMKLFIRGTTLEDSVKSLSN